MSSFGSTDFSPVAPVSRRLLARALGLAALAVALFLQLGLMVSVALFRIRNIDRFDDLFWLNFPLLSGLALVPVGYVACLKGSRRGIQVATAVAGLLAAIVVAVSVAVADVGDGFLSLESLGYVLVFGMPAWALAVGVVVMRRVTRS